MDWLKLALLDLLIKQRSEKAQIFSNYFNPYSELILLQGKLAAQIGHASLGVYQTTPSDILKQWEEDGLHSRICSGSETIIQGLIRAAQQNNIQYR